MRRNVPSSLRKFGRWRPTARNVVAGQATPGDPSSLLTLDVYKRKARRARTRCRIGASAQCQSQRRIVGRALVRNLNRQRFCSGNWTRPSAVPRRGDAPRYRQNSQLGASSTRPHGMAVEPSALLSIHRVYAQVPGAEGPVAPLSTARGLLAEIGVASKDCCK